MPARQKKTASSHYSRSRHGGASRRSHCGEHHPARYRHSLQINTLDGIDALLSTVQMPSGIPVATVAINGGANAALLSAQMLALSEPELAKKLDGKRAADAKAVLEKDAVVSAELNSEV